MRSSAVSDSSASSWRQSGVRLPVRSSSAAREGVTDHVSPYEVRGSLEAAGRTFFEGAPETEAARIPDIAYTGAEKPIPGQTGPPEPREWSFDTGAVISGLRESKPGLGVLNTREGSFYARQLSQDWSKESNQGLNGPFQV